MNFGKLLKSSGSVSSFVAAEIIAFSEMLREVLEIVLDM